MRPPPAPLTPAIVITGGLGVIGTAVGNIIVAKGGYVVALDVVPNEAGAAALAKRTLPKAWYYQQADITSHAAVKAAVDAAMQVIPPGSLAGAVHCAAVNPHDDWTGRMSDSIANFDKCLRVNALGTFIVDAVVADAINSQYPPREAFAERVTEERGSIVNVASVVAYDTPARCLTYGPSKSASVESVS